MATKRQLAIIRAAFQNNARYRNWFSQNYNPEVFLDLDSYFLESIESADEVFKVIYPFYSAAEFKAAFDEKKEILFRTDVKNRQATLITLEKVDFVYQPTKARNALKKIIMR